MLLARFLVPATIAIAALAVAIVTFAMRSDETSAGPATVFTVNTTDDHDDMSCDVSPGDCTFHEAIDAANATNPATIAFDLPNCPPACTIDISTNPPSIFGNNIAIDGSTQDGWVDDPIVVLNWVGAGIGDGPAFTGDDSSIMYMAITNFRTGLGLYGARDSAIRNHVINTDSDGIRGAGPDHLFADNIVDGSGRTGMSAASGDGAPGAEITGNTITGSAETGMIIQGDDVTISGNTVTNNEERGIIASFGNSNVAIVGNLVADNGEFGIQTSFDPGAVTDNTVSGNGWTGLDVEYGNIAIARNIVTGNGFLGGGFPSRMVGIEVYGSDLALFGNDVYENAGAGMWVEAVSIQIGGTGPDEPNIISGNGGPGIYMPEAGETLAQPSGLEFDPRDNTISANAIYNNGSLGIDLAPEGVTANDPLDTDSGANRRQNYPILESATSGSLNVTGFINTRPEAPIRIEFFVNEACDPSGYGEGREYIGSVDVMTDLSGDASFSPNLDATVPSGHYITATATHTGTHDTSEFSACVEVDATAATATPTPTPTPPAGSPTPTPTATPTGTATPTPTGSAGQQVAWGDDDCDGDTDAVDALKNLQHVAAIPFQQNAPCFPLGESVNVSQPAGFGAIVYGDADCDGDVDAVDALQILRFVAGLQPNQQPGCPPIGDNVIVS